MPAYGNYGRDKGYDAEAAITKFRAVKVGSGAEGVTPVTADTDLIVGVAQFGVTADEILQGKGASVREEGITEWEAGGAITMGALVGVDSSGRCIALASGKRCHGRARQAASGSGKRIAVDLTRNGHIAA